ncbi:glucose 1-dehydrogenase [Parvibaculum sp.]|jgi:NAD(P)-dependent dehydrogenase (short-subunit alcohol dehydrogenase family)|uniref:SDR family NAD(P)-dependent oxidoreductase n=1 Tax=Parvibaculum sp. TaxID=2024848 RepID=UPI000C410476|nr:glucose 1-dehydrogenase [Parvibaculum sp.]MAU59607.1 dehydrogenase [Parvibaculum sp.]MBO6667866.1 glucose 1-dehydrogenase [Parvibaculum sp.]MBO6690729.1 glucose 1-dehydrogenase [Parvibaculum sp.]MBO6714898.1 glucose 1-dehydrogenase [Parvibaculum sp.]|tara:strand:+ start:695 stop:1525 length:831 start_codon:yes stop_codon:yes gene_type:complete
MASGSQLSGKVAIVTGAANGIGRAVAHAFANEGAKLVLADVDEEAGEEVAAEIADRGGEAIFRYCDVGERLDVRNLVCAATDAFERVDILVNNAGVVSTGSDFLSLEEEEFDRVIRVNLKGCFLVGQAVAQRMVQQVEEGGAPGTIINMSSINAVVAIPGQAAYSASKGGIKQLTEAMALALAPHGIRVNAIGPGTIKTAMAGTVIDPKAEKAILSRTPLGRVGEPSEIASIAVFLASDGASYMTGQTVYADGGRLSLNYTALPLAKKKDGDKKDD